MRQSWIFAAIGLLFVVLAAEAPAQAKGRNKPQAGSNRGRSTPVRPKPAPVRARPQPRPRPTPSAGVRPNAGRSARGIRAATPRPQPRQAAPRPRPRQAAPRPNSSTRRRSPQPSAPVRRRNTQASPPTPRSSRHSNAAARVPSVKRYADGARQSRSANHGRQTTNTSPRSSANPARRSTVDTRRRSGNSPARQPSQNNRSQRRVLGGQVGRRGRPATNSKSNSPAPLPTQSSSNRRKEAARAQRWQRKEAQRRAAHRDATLRKQKGRDIDPRRRVVRSKEAYGRGGLATVQRPVALEKRKGRQIEARQLRASKLRRIDAGREARRQSQGRSQDVTRRLPPVAKGSGKGAVNTARAGQRRGGRDHRRGDKDHNHSSLSINFFAGGRGWGFGVGYSKNNYYDHGWHSSAVSFGFGGGYDYSHSYLHSGGYEPYWRNHYYGRGHLGYSSPAHLYFGKQVDFRYHSRLHFGYNFYYPYAYHTPYPFYRTCYYEPWYVQDFALRTPVYRTYHYVSEPAYCVSDSYVETADPYVEEDVVLTLAEIANTDALADVGDLDHLDPVPVALRSSFSAEVAADLRYDEYLAWGEEALFTKRYFVAAEAFRRAMKLRWEDDYPKFQLAAALFGAGRYDVAFLALELGLTQNPTWLYRHFDLRSAFVSKEEFDTRVQALERHLIRHDGLDDFRFLLGYVYFFSGNLFGARSVFKTLEESPRPYPHLDVMSREAEKRLLLKAK